MREASCKVLAAVHDGIHHYICKPPEPAADVAQAAPTSVVDSDVDVDLSPPLPPPPPPPLPPPPPPHVWKALAAHAGNAYPANTVNWQAIIALACGSALGLIFIRWLVNCCKPKEVPPLSKVEQWRIDHLRMFGQQPDAFAEPPLHQRLEPRLVAAKRALPPLYDKSPWASPDDRSRSHFLLPVDQRTSPVFGAPRVRSTYDPLRMWGVSIPGSQSPNEPKLTPKRAALVTSMLHKMITSLTPRTTPRLEAHSAAASPTRTPRSERMSAPGDLITDVARRFGLYFRLPSSASASNPLQGDAQAHDGSTSNATRAARARVEALLERDRPDVHHDLDPSLDHEAATRGDEEAREAKEGDDSMRYEDMRPWVELAPSERDAARALGYSELAWDRGSAPPQVMRRWAELSASEAQAARRLGYAEVEWDAEVATMAATASMQRNVARAQLSPFTAAASPSWSSHEPGRLAGSAACT